MKKLLLLIFPIFLSCPIQESYPDGEATLIFYLGDDTGFSSLNLMNDILELSSRQVDISNKRVIILFDGTEQGDTQLFALDSLFDSTFREIKLSDTDIKLESSNEANMGDPEVLSSYISYVKSKLPSDFYALYIGGHGTGYNNYYTSSLLLEINEEGDDPLTTIEISSVLNLSPVNLLAFDACMMGNLENIYEMEGGTDYVVASPENIPGPGNNYTYLIENFYSESTDSPFKLGLETLNSYYEGYSNNTLGANEQQQTQSPWIADNQLLQLYDVDGISNVIKNQDFQEKLITAMESSSNREYIYDRYSRAGYYSGFYKELNLPEIDNHIYTAELASEKLISIYYPGSIFEVTSTGATIKTIREEYKNMRFANHNPLWISHMESR